MSSLDDHLEQLKAEFTHKQQQGNTQPEQSQPESNLFADIEAKFQQTTPNPSMSSNPPSRDSQTAQNDDSQADQTSRALEDLQAQFTQQAPSETSDLDQNLAKFQSSKPAQPPSQENSPVNHNLAELQAQLSQRQPDTPVKQPPVSAKTDQLLADLQADFSEKQQQSPLPTNPQTDLQLTEMMQGFQQQQKEGEIVEERLKNQEQFIQEQRKQEWKKQQRRKALEKKAKQWLNELDPYSDEGLWFEEFAYNYPSKLEAAIDYLAVLWDNQQG
ncbi:hypothetical protein PN462_02445 [Spirulina sp. CS-785/01]|uniref:salt stress protein, Slr1339 family n=1 Tax=Spirulina sp. CS-785/01 TaxID=3021716 RepID=UPI00232C89C6|nr:hypothetical protein [Spirulina sp. CS-785/01]MDB9311947.1 hypothetical protein [Spirulina sp. CS-785/01]